MFTKLIAFITARVQAATESQVTGRMAELQAAIDQAVAAGVAAAMAKIEKPAKVAALPKGKRRGRPPGKASANRIAAKLNHALTNGLSIDQ